MNKYEAESEYDLMTTCISPLSLGDLPFDDSVFKLKLDYGSIFGSTRLKNAIASLYENQTSENISVTHGAIGANHLVFLSLIENGDETVSIVPVYQQLYSVPKALGADVKLYFLREENNWLPDLDELERLITPRTKLLCINNPNNPTGSVISDCMLEEIVRIAQKNDVWILSDETYRGLNLYGNPYSKSVADMYSKGISTGSMSKTYSLPGLRVGWAVGNTELISRINRQRQYNTISVNPLDDYFSSVALENRDFISDRNFRIMRNGLKVLSEWLDKNKDWNCVLPSGGTTVFMKYPQNIPSEEFCLELLKNTGVGLIPGETMEMYGYVRLGYCADNLQKALQKLGCAGIPKTTVF